MQLTKTQVLALFLSTASAKYTDADIINGPFTNIKPGSKATLENSLKACNGNSDCVPEGGCPEYGEAGYKSNCVEKCASYQVGDTVEAMKETIALNYCIKETLCFTLGKAGGEAWSLQCWTDPAAGETASAPAKVENLKNLNALDFVLQKEPEDGAYANGNPVWATTDYLWVSAKSNFQDGWWHTADPSKKASWIETDKAVDNRCGDDEQCEASDKDTCCMTWPDQNNLRCGKKSLADKVMKIGQLSFTPQCESGWNNVPEDIGNAGDLIAEKALAEASEELKEFFGAQLSDAKKNAGYDDLTADKKKEFDTAQIQVTKKRDEEIAAFKKAAKVDGADCKLDCKKDFEVDLNKWFKSVYETCKSNANSIECRESYDLRLKEETARGAGDKNFYNGMDSTEQTSYKKVRDEEVKKEESSLAAAWIKNNVPKDGEVGSACDAETIPAKCSAATHCCGTATPKEGAFVKEAQTICNVRTAEIFNDQLGEPFTFKCQEMAKNIAASVATIGAFAYSLM